VIIDTSALVAILIEEPEGDAFLKLIESTPECRISVVSWVELAMVLAREARSTTPARAELFLHQSGIQIEPVTIEQGQIARQAFLDFGKGRHKAGLNFGDCFSYALAKSTGEPLLFKGNDFRYTDIVTVG
jgi:ribonuclease VapC